MTPPDPMWPGQTTSDDGKRWFVTGDVATIEAAIALGAPLARDQVTDAWHKAIEHGRIAMMAYLREFDSINCDWVGHRIVRPFRRILGPCGRAARFGQLAALQWLRCRGCREQPAQNCRFSD